MILAGLLPAGIFVSGRSHVGSSRAPDRPVEAGGECEARAGGHGIDDKIAEPRVPSRHPKLQDFEQADQGDGNRRRRPAVAAVGQTERQSDQDKGEGVFAVSE